MAVKRDAARTREKILSAATKEFAARGYEGARVDEIARRASSNKNMIYHYFGSKENLFQAVLERMYQSIRERQRDLSILDLAPEAGVRALVEFTFDVFVETPEFISLLSSENFCKARHILNSDIIIPMYNPLLTTIRELVKRGAEAGVFRDGVDPIDLYISISALTCYYLSNRYTLSALFGTELMAKDRLSQRYGHAADMVLRYLRK